MYFAREPENGLKLRLTDFCAQTQAPDEVSKNPEVEMRLEK